MFCISCGNQLKDGVSFCPACGMPVRNGRGQGSGDRGFEQALVSAARNGNETSFEELYQLYYQKVFALARMTVKNEADAEDILQQTFISAWQNIGRLADANAFNTWLQRICLNHCYTLLRKRRVRVPVMAEIETDDAQAADAEAASDMTLPEAYAEKADLKERLGRIIDELSDVQRQTLTLYYFSGLSVEEIARTMEVSEGTVKSRLFLARKAIRTEIGEQERKSGQKFYGVGVPLVPFAVLFRQKVEAEGLSAGAAAALFKTVSRTVTGQAAANGAVTNGAARSALKASAKRFGKGVLSRAAAAVLAVSMMAGGTAGAAFQASAVETFPTPSIPGAPTAGPADGGEAGPTEPDRLTVAYTAYLDLLLDRRKDIDGYDWQRSYPVEGLTRGVVLSDVAGDDVPELIYMEGKDNGHGYMECAVLYIVTAGDGEIKMLFSSEGWDVQAGGGHHYYLFKQRGDDRLYAYTSSGDEVWVTSYMCFSERPDGTLELGTVCEYEADRSYENSGSFYRVDGREATEARYERKVKELEGATSEVLIYSDDVPAFVNDFVAENRCPAMTCGEAIEVLRGLLGIGHEAGDGTPAPEIFSEMPSTFWLSGDVGFWHSQLTVHSDGSFTGYYQDTDIGDTGEGYSGTVYYSEYTGSFQNPMKLNDYTYSFEVGPIDYKGTDGDVTMSDEYSADGVNPIRNVFIESATFSEGETVYLYTPGASLSELPEGFKHWVHPSDGEKTLSVFGLYVTKSEYGFLGSFDDVEPSVRQVKFDQERHVDLNWGWGLFEKDAYEYDHDLAMAALILSKAAEMGMSDVEERLSALGFENMSSKWYDLTDGDQNNPGITFASRAVTLNGKTTVIAAIVVRGSADLPDRGTNFNSPFNGFFPAGHNVAEEFKEYYNGLDEYYGIDVSNENTTLFITGHSQGGAVAGQLAKMLEIICAKRNRIFDYTFASPKYETFADDTDAYRNVHNIINVYDLVPQLPLGYKRYGHDWYYVSTMYSGQQLTLYGLGAYLLDINFNIGHEHDLLTYLACMVSDTPANMGEGAVNRYSLSSVHCPVDIRICAPDGTLMAWTEGESVFYGDDPKALVMTDGDEKYVIASQEVEYTIIFVGTGEGTMDYEQQVLDGAANESLSETAYAGVPVGKGITYAASVSKGHARESVLYEINESGRAINRMNKNGEPSRVVFKSDFWGWLSVACAGIGAVVFAIDSIALIRLIRRKKRSDTGN